VSEEVSELDAWLEKAAPPPPPPPRLKVGAKVRILVWGWCDVERETYALQWEGLMGSVVGRGTYRRNVWLVRLDGEEGASGVSEDRLKVVDG
jgi:hypothetical protein